MVFQSTHPSGVRRVDHRRGLAGERISIHAPQWGATCRRSGHARPSRHFNPRTPVGCDGAMLRPCPMRSYFNPRTPVGCDPMFPRAAEGLKISIHAPQWGATLHEAGDVVDADISIHAPQWGATQHPGHRDHAHHISIHAPQWGATARMGIAFHNTEAPSVLKTDFIAKIHVHRSIHKFSNQKHQQTIHF